MVIKIMTLGQYATNCYIVSSGAECVIFDPSDEKDLIIDYIRRRNYSVKSIFLTHGHFDHIQAVDAIVGEMNCSVFIHPDDVEMLTDPQKNASLECIGKPVIVKTVPEPMEDGKLFCVGQEQFRVIHTPGHTKGSVCFEFSDCIFTGDTVFQNGYGRTDFYGGSFEQLKSSLKILFPIIKNKTIYGGHNY